MMELKAAAMLLDKGVRVSYTLPNGKKNRGFTMRHPYVGTLVRISRRYVKMGVKMEDIDNMSHEEEMQFVAKYGVAVSEIVALSIVRSWFLGIMVPVVAWWLRWRCHPAMLMEAWWQFVNMLNLKDFRSITKSVSVINILQPRV